MESESVIHGTLAACKGREQHGLPRPFDALKGCFTKMERRFKPVLGFRQSYYNTYRVYPTFTTPIANDKWIIEELSLGGYDAGRRGLLTFALLRPDDMAEKNTLRSGKNLRPASGRHLRMEMGKRNNLGHCAAMSSISERYGRSVCSAELQLRGLHYWRQYARAGPCGIV